MTHNNRKTRIRKRKINKKLKEIRKIKGIIDKTKVLLVNNI